MAYCTRCGKQIMDGERCSCQKKRLGFGDFFGSDESTDNGFSSYSKNNKDPKASFERGMKIVPENVMPDEGEQTICQYDLCRLRSRIRFMFADGRLQITNKRILFRAKGTSLTGPTVSQQEFSISELSGFRIIRNFRFSFWDLLFMLILSSLCLGLGLAFANACHESKSSGILLAFLYLVGLVACVGTRFIKKRKFIPKACLAGFAAALLGMPAIFLYFRAELKDNGFQVFISILLMLPALVALILKVANDFLFSFKPNLQFGVCSKMGSEVINIRCEPSGFGKIVPMIAATFTGYNEVLPTDETDLAIREVGAIISDIQKLGDLAIDKWKRD